MARRTKQELLLMKSIVSKYLHKNNLDAHKAFEDMVTYYLENGSQMPYYIKSIKDFIKISKELQNEINIANNELELKKIYEIEKSKVIDFILQCDIMTLKNIYKDIKHSLNEKQKYDIMEIIMLKHNDELSEKYIEVRHINTFKNHLSFEN